MADPDTDTETETAAAKDPTPGQEANRILYRAIARGLARMDADKGNLKSVWNDGRTKYINDARKLAKALKKERVTLTVAPKADDADAAEDSED